MGIETVALYSDVDGGSLHVQEADIAWHLPGATPRETYLDIGRVLSAAGETQADAVHPGYGFLSENPLFARRCHDSGLTFVGPSAHAIELLGSKTAARAIAIDAGVPVMPGTVSAIATIDEAREEARRIGYPVLLKAAAGGGGKGMRVVEREEGLEEGLRAARGEARTAFNSDEVFLEKFITGPRHIELQILADAAGGVAVLGERECSVQRRHQKVVEESPSTAVTDETRREIFRAAEALVRTAGYTNAGTLEFLMDREGMSYFLEVNARLQVEHPVTEMVTGLDIVEWQLRIARGESLPFTTDTITRRGHAIECRICAEDVYQGFLPSTGVVQEVVEPAGKNVRVDSALYDGMPVSLHYDPMLAKLVVWGESRDEAIAAMVRSLDQYHIAGIGTTIPFCRFVMQDDTFRSGDYSTLFVSERWRDRKQRLDDGIQHAAMAAALVTHLELEDRLALRNTPGKR